MEPAPVGKGDWFGRPLAGVGQQWSDLTVNTTASADGTTIAFDTIGSGPPVVVIGGAFSTADAGRPLAAALAAVGRTGVVMDRRGRGGSGDSAPYAPEREAEDIVAVIAAVGGDAAVLGHSSGAILTLLAAADGAPMTHAFLSEPPFRFGVGEPAGDFPARLQELVDQGRPEEAVTLFQREGVGLPDAVIDNIRSAPFYPALVAIAQTVVYDATIARHFSTPSPAMLATPVPVTILRGDPTYPLLVEAADRLARAMPVAEVVVVPESRDHGVDPAGTSREIVRILDAAADAGPR